MGPSLSPKPETLNHKPLADHSLEPDRATQPQNHVGWSLGFRVSGLGPWEHNHIPESPLGPQTPFSPSWTASPGSVPTPAGSAIRASGLGLNCQRYRYRCGCGCGRDEAAMIATTATATQLVLPRNIPVLRCLYHLHHPRYLGGGGSENRVPTKPAVVFWQY